MLTSGLDPEARFNLSNASVLVLDASQHALDVITQILKGFGVANVHRFDTVQAATKFFNHRSVDLIIVDPSVEDGRGYDFVVDLRHSGKACAMAPVILVSGHVRKAAVNRARNTGANYVVTKPLSPTTLLQRILWVAKDRRPFVEVGCYIGPDRRFKFEGPPSGSSGRRADDLKDPLGDADEPNLSQDELDAFVRPQRVTI